MFGWKKTPPIRTLIGEGTVITGEIRFADGLRIDGEVIGNISCTGDTRSLLVISEKARVVGKVRAGHVIINGSVEGPVMAEDLLELQPKARIVGDVRYEALEMHQGATIDGELRPLKTEDKPNLKLAASSANAQPDRAATAQAVLTSQIQKI
jgi:cytoskeletal protein CcmA (bactofilin family)